MAMQSSKLAKLKMPADAASKKKASAALMGDESISPDDQDFSDLGSHAHGGADLEEESHESPAEEAQEEKADSAALDHIPDDELMAELKKRGLMSKLAAGKGEPDGDESDEQDDYSLMA